MCLNSKWVCVLVFLLSYNLITAQFKLSDKKATRETREVYQLLQNISGNSMLFGHHLTNTHGIGWIDKKGKTNNSDVKLATNDFPAIFSFDFRKGFDDIENAVIMAHNDGGIVTISWHLQNIATNGDYKDTTGNVVQRIIPSGDLHKNYKELLKKVASFAKGLKDNDGKRIPIIFRPFHENTGNWFWWGLNHCSPEEYKELWLFTVNYLRKTKNVHNIIYAYSPSRPFELKNETYETRYPGNDYVDIIGFDHYGKDDFSEKLLKDCRIVVEFAEKNNKVPAITEFGVQDGIQNTTLSNWYMDAFLSPIKNDSIARKVAYAVTWANRKNEKWIPLKNDIHYDGFLEFHKDPFVWFLKDLNTYKSEKNP